MSDWLRVQRLMWRARFTWSDRRAFRGLLDVAGDQLSGAQRDLLCRYESAVMR